jgi:hypothetical protein
VAQGHNDLLCVTSHKQNSNNPVQPEERTSLCVLIWCSFAYLQQLEALQKSLIPAQEAILQLGKAVAALPQDKREGANEALTTLKKVDVALRDRLFVLQVWRKYDQETAERMARQKAGEFEDPALTKALDEREKKLEREKREREKDKMKFQNQAKRYKGGAQSYSEPGSSVGGNFHRATSFPRGQNRGGKRPGAENRCHICGSQEHFFKSCPSKK